MKDYREMADNVLRRWDAYKIKKRKNIKIAASALSCFCVMAVLGTGGWYSGILTGDDSGQVKNVKDVQSEDINTTDTSDTYDEAKQMAAERESNAAEQESQQSAIRDLSADKNDEASTKPDNSGTNDVDATAESNSNSTAEPTGAEVTIDVPVSDIPGDTGALTAYDEVWGGCYMDENGCWVVWLTQDTPENRQRVFALNPTLNDENTIFKAAAYSKAYLTYLMAEISNAMCAGKLPLVTTAALREDKNCVEVTMISDDPWSVDKVLAFDTAGGAIEIIYNSEEHVIIDLEEYGVMDLIKKREEP